MNYLWIVEASSYPFKKWNPIFKFGGDAHKSCLSYGMHASRRMARLAAEYMKTNNEYNKIILTAKYRVRKYISQ